MERRRRPQRILVVDDSNDIREMWRMWLEAHGFDVQETTHGADALRQIEGEPPDLVLLDVMMPVIDGLETLKRLRAQKNTSTIGDRGSAQGTVTARMARQLGSDALPGETGQSRRPAETDSVATRPLMWDCVGDFG
jgi:CheY-like chemotaxis protein